MGVYTTTKTDDTEDWLYRFRNDIPGLVRKVDAWDASANGSQSTRQLVAPALRGLDMAKLKQFVAAQKVLDPAGTTRTRTYPRQFIDRLGPWAPVTLRAPNEENGTGDVLREHRDLFGKSALPAEIKQQADRLELGHKKPGSLSPKQNTGWEQELAQKNKRPPFV